MPSKLTLTYTDYGGERSTVNFRGKTLDDVSYIFADYNTQMDSLITAVQALTLGRHYRTQRVSSEGVISPSNATQVWAQREIKWLCRYTDDTTGQAYQVEIPAADLNLLDANNPGMMDKDSTEYGDFKTAFETFVQSPDGNDVTLGDVIAVGRNL